jgi:hypothetical protein
MNPAGGPHADSQRGRMAIPGFGEPHEIADLVAWLLAAVGLRRGGGR